MPDAPSAAYGEHQPCNYRLIPNPKVSQGGLSFLTFCASHQVGEGVGTPVCPTGAWPAFTLSLLVRLPLPCPVPALPSLAAKSRAILLPMDLDAHMSALLSSGGSCSAAAQRSAANYKTATRTFPRVIPTANQWDYKNIIEKLQVGVAARPLGKARSKVVGGWGELLPLGQTLFSVEWVGRVCSYPGHLGPGGDLALPPRTSSQP